MRAAQAVLLTLVVTFASEALAGLNPYPRNQKPPPARPQIDQRTETLYEIHEFPERGKFENRNRAIFLIEEGGYLTISLAEGTKYESLIPEGKNVSTQALRSEIRKRHDQIASMTYTDYLMRLAAFVAGSGSTGAGVGYWIGRGVPRYTVEPVSVANLGRANAVVFIATPDGELILSPGKVSSGNFSSVGTRVGGIFGTISGLIHFVVYKEAKRTTLQLLRGVERALEGSYVVAGNFDEIIELIVGTVSELPEES